MTRVPLPKAHERDKLAFISLHAERAQPVKRNDDGKLTLTGVIFVIDIARTQVPIPSQDSHPSLPRALSAMSSLKGNCSAITLVSTILGNFPCNNSLKSS